MEGNPHVDDLVLLQINLGRTPGALDNNDVVLRPEGVQRLRHVLPQHGFGAGEVGCGRLGNRLAQEHDLGLVIGLRLEQDGIHLHLRLHSAGLRLHRLGPTQLAAVRSNKGVIGHVLGLEGRDAISVLPENAA